MAANLVASFLKPPESLSHLQIIACSVEGEPKDVHFIQFGLQRRKHEVLAPLGGEILMATNSTHMFHDFHAFGFACETQGGGPGTVKIVCNGNVAQIRTSIPCVALAPHGFTAAVSLFVEDHACIQILDTVEYKNEHTVRLPGMDYGGVCAMIFAPNCSVLAASDSFTIFLIDVMLGTLVWRSCMYSAGSQLFDWLAFSPDNNALAVATSGLEREIESRILASNFDSESFAHFLPDSQDQQIQCIVYSPCVSAVALSGDFGIYIQNVFSGELHRLCVGHHVGVVVYTPCGGSLAIEWEGGVRIIDVHSGAVAHEFQLKDSGFEIVSLSYVVTADTVRGTD